EDRPRMPSTLPPMVLKLGGEYMNLGEAPRRQAYSKEKFIREEIGKLESDGIITKSKSPISSQVVVVPKKGNTFRMCVDYRRVNLHLEDLKFPLPRIDDIFHTLEGKKWFAVLDLKSGYHQILLEKSSAYISAFVTSTGLFEYTRVPFGLKTAPAYFQMFCGEPQIRVDEVE
ncbi:hypothetical protein ADUPG1_000932, partial [Aduncisulcus paluster]